LQFKKQVEKMLNKVIIIGASIVDVIGMPLLPLKKGDSTPGKVLVSAGGVARNIAENIQRIGINVTLISAIGNDLFGKVIVTNANELKININQSIIHNEKPTSFYLLITNDSGNPELAISDTSIIEVISQSFIESKRDLIEKHKIIVIDTNLPTETINYLAESFNNQDIFIDLVSTAKAKKAKELIGKFHTIKPNIEEAEVLSDIKYNNENDLLKMRDYFLHKGVKQLFISMGEKGSFYANSEIHGIISGRNVSIVNSSGAGDAYMAGLIYSYLKDKTIKETACFASACSLIAMQKESAVNPQISLKMINNYIKKYLNQN
jgi:pseudouridine kinase